MKVKNGDCNPDYRHRVAVKGRAARLKSWPQRCGCVQLPSPVFTGVCCQHESPQKIMYILSLHKSVYSFTPIYQDTATRPTFTATRCNRAKLYSLGFAPPPLASYRPAFLQARLQNEKVKYQIPHVYSAMNAQTVSCSSSLSISMTDFCYLVTRLEGRFLGKVYANATFLSCVTTWKVAVSLSGSL